MSVLKFCIYGQTRTSESRVLHPSQKSLRALVVDDVPFIRQLITGILSQEGWDVVEAGSGAEALELLSRDRNFSVILMDIYLSGHRPSVSFAQRD